MDITEALEKIEGFRSRGNNWFDLADIVQAIARSGSWRSHYSSSAEWIKDAARVSGYHPAVIRRMVRVKDFLDRVINEEGISVGEGCNVPLASLEVLERMHTVAPGKATELVADALNGKATLREVQKAYDQLVKQQPDKADKAGLVRREARAFDQRAIRAIEDSVGLFSGKATLSFFRRSDSGFPIEVDLIAATAGEGGPTQYDGYNILFSGYGNAMKIDTVLQRIAFSCDFFRRYWVVMPEDEGIELGKFLYPRLKLLKLNNVYFAHLKDHPQSEAPEGLWGDITSVYQQRMSSPSQPGFFQSEKDYIPRWAHLLQERVADLASL